MDIAQNGINPALLVKGWGIFVKFPGSHTPLVETCALPARKGLLPLLAFAGPSQESGPMTAQGFAVYGHIGQTAGP